MKKNNKLTEGVAQRVLDNHHVGKLNELKAIFDNAWEVKTNQGRFVIYSFYPKMHYEIKEEIFKSIEDKLKEMLHAEISMMYLPSYSGDKVIKFVHKDDQYFSVFKINEIIGNLPDKFL